MRYATGFLIFVAVLVFGLVLIFHHGGGSKKAQPLYLPSYANTSTVVRFNIDGPVVYNTNHHEIEITVGQTQNTLEVIEGYQNQVIQSNTYPNNASAYNEFLNALQLNNYTKGQKIDIASTGACAQGVRYYLKVIDGSGNELQNLWTSTCNEGSYAGEEGPIESLFQAQIPNYQEQVNPYGLN